MSDLTDEPRSCDRCGQEIDRFGEYCDSCRDEFARTKWILKRPELKRPELKRPKLKRPKLKRPKLKTARARG